MRMTKRSLIEAAKNSKNIDEMDRFFSTRCYEGEVFDKIMAVVPVALEFLTRNEALVGMKSALVSGNIDELKLQRQDFIGATIKLVEYGLISSNEFSVKRGRGRPKGSTNKPKAYVPRAIDVRGENERNNI